MADFKPFLTIFRRYSLFLSTWFVNFPILAACIEIRNALNHSEGPENYISHLTIHQDGSCNGLQHYSALGRDKLGATYVNVVPGKAPQDIYSEIATLVEEKRSADEDKSVDIAAILKGFVRRKVIKQTVMTTVYGVTMYGAELQIAKQLKEINDFPQDRVKEGSSYLAGKTFESLNEMFTSSQAIQAWFTDCAQVIAGVFILQKKSKPLYFRSLNFPAIFSCSIFWTSKENKTNVS